MKIPTAWETGCLGDLFETVTGSTPPKSQKDNYGNDFSFVKPPELLDSEIGETSDNLSAKGASISRTVPSGSILISCIGNLGKVGISEDTVAFNQQINAIKQGSNFVPKFMFYQALSPGFKNQLESLVSGTTVPIVNKSKFNTIQVALPPIPEQIRIVAILDQVFADIDKARVLTEQNLKNARELFESYLQQVFSQCGEGWVECTLGDIAEFKNGLNYSKNSKGEIVKVAGVKDFQSNYAITEDQFEMAQIDGDLNSSYELNTGDILTVRSNGNKRLIGRCVLIESVDQKASFSGFIIRIRLTEDNVIPAFLTYYLKSPKVHEQLIGSGGGANISNLNQKTLTSLPVALPTFDVQSNLVKNLDELKARSENLVNIYLKKLDVLDNLKKSILQKAFSGEFSKEYEEAAA